MLVKKVNTTVNTVNMGTEETNTETCHGRSSMRRLESTSTPWTATLPSLVSPVAIFSTQSRTSSCGTTPLMTLHPRLLRVPATLTGTSYFTRLRTSVLLVSLVSPSSPSSWPPLASWSASTCSSGAWLCLLAASLLSLPLASSVSSPIINSGASTQLRQLTQQLSPSWPPWRGNWPSIPLHTWLAPLRPISSMATGSGLPT